VLRKLKILAYNRLANNIIWFGLFLCLIYWVLDAIIQAGILGAGNLLDHIFSPDSHEIWTRTLVSFILIASSGLAHSVFGKRNEAERALREKERFLQNVFDGIQDGISVLDRDLNILRVNSWMEKMYADQMPLVGRKCYEAYQQRDSVCPWCPCIRTIKTGEVQADIVPYPSAENQLGWIELSGFPLKDEGGHTIGIIEHVRDITERKMAEDALRESEEKYGNLFQHSYDAILIHDAEGNILDVNQRTLDIFGYAKSEIVSLKISQLHPAHALKTSQYAFERIKQDGSVKFEIEFKKKNGETFPAEVASSMFRAKGMDIIQGVVRDISDRKKALKSLQDSEELFRSIAEQSQIGMGILQDGVLKFINEAAASIAGCSVNEVMAWKAEEFIKVIHPEDRALILEQARKKQAGDKDTINRYSLRVIDKTGNIRKVEQYSQTITYKGRPADFFSIIDVAARDSSAESRIMPAEQSK
jgi:PAS domain S-box-containing protein